MSQSDVLPESTLRVERLSVFPIKSCGDIACRALVVTPEGVNGLPLQGKQAVPDRGWALIATDKEGAKVITQRDYPQLALIQPFVLDTGELAVYYPNQAWQAIPSTPADAPIIEAQAKFGGPVRGTDLGDQISTWFTRALLGPDSTQQIRLIATQPNNPRRANDGHQLSIASTQTTKWLNPDSKLKGSRFGKRFRMNVELSGFTEPHAELAIGHLVISKTVRLQCEPCGRCVVIDTDPATGQKDKRGLSTLLQPEHRQAASEFLPSTFDKRKPYYGLWVTEVIAGGVIRLGDQVESIPARAL